MFMIREFECILSRLLYFGFVAYVLHNWDWSYIVKLEKKYLLMVRSVYIHSNEIHNVVALIVY